MRLMGNGGMALVLMASFIVLTSCKTLPDGLDDAYQSSIPYDTVSCGDLKTQREALQKQFPNLPPDEAERYPLHVLAALPDFRDQDIQQATLAKGQINAMTRSLRRRGCNDDGEIEKEAALLASDL